MKSIFCLKIGLLASLFTFAQRHLGPVTGFNLKEAEYEGSKEGRFVRTDGLSWKEINKDGRHSFEEFKRDEQSVFLVDKSRNYTVQLQLHENKIYSDPLGKKTELYTISQSEPGRFTHLANGYNVNTVTYTGVHTGKFSRIAGGNWTEENEKGVYKWTEEKREQWKVVLTDSSKKTTISIGLANNKIENEVSKAPLYEITKSAAGRVKPAAKGDNLKEVEYTGTANGRFLYEGNMKWLELNTESQHHFVEVKYDEWSVYLTDKTRNVTVEINLRNKKIYSDPFGNKTEAYTISKTSVY